MATIKTTYSSKTQTYTTNSGTNTLNKSNYVQRVDIVPDRVSGGTILLPGGNRFRKATNYLKVQRWIEPGEGQLTISKTGFPPSPVTVRGPGGGYASDPLQDSRFPDVAGKVKSVLRLNGYPQLPDSMRSEAATKALLKIADQKAGIGENLATFRQTLDLLHKPGWNLVNAIRNMFKNPELRPFFYKSARDIRHAKELTRGAAQTYLEYVYGLKPLMSDVKGVVDLAIASGAKTLLLYGDGYSYQQGQLNNVSYTDFSAQAITGLTSSDERAKAHCKIWGRIDPNCPGLRSLNQLGLINPLSLAWELVPFSFVVDWVLPIGPCLQALTAPAGLIFVDGSQSIRSNITATFDHHQYSWDALASTNNFADGTFRYEGYSRSVLTGWPLPGVWVNEHPFANNDRSLKALALAITNLRFLR